MTKPKFRLAPLGTILKRLAALALAVGICAWFWLTVWDVLT